MPPLRSTQDVQQYLKSLDAQEPPEIVVQLFEHFATHAVLYRALLGRNGSTWFTSRISDSIVGLKQEHGRTFLARNPGIKQKMRQMEMPLEMSTMIAVHLLLITIVFWLESGEQYSPRTMAMWYHRFLMHGVEGYLRDNGLFDTHRSTRP